MSVTISNMIRTYEGATGNDTWQQNDLTTTGSNICNYMADSIFLRVVVKRYLGEVDLGYLIRLNFTSCREGFSGDLPYISCDELIRQIPSPLLHVNIVFCCSLLPIQVSILIYYTGAMILIQ